MGLEPSINNCKCDIIDYGSGTLEIVFCPKHAAADALLKACIAADCNRMGWWDTVKDAIAQATKEVDDA